MSTPSRQIRHDDPAPRRKEEVSQRHGVAPAMPVREPSVLLRYLQRTTGNEAVNQLLRRYRAQHSSAGSQGGYTDAASGDSTTVAELPGLEAEGNRPPVTGQVQGHAIQRQPLHGGTATAAPGGTSASARGPSATAPDGSVTIHLGDQLTVEAHTYGDLLGLSRFGVDQLQRALGDVEQNDPVRERGQQWIAAMNAWRPELERRSGEPLTQFAANQANNWAVDLGEIMQAIQVARRVAVRRAVDAARQRIDDVTAQLTPLEPQIADAMRAAFLSRDQSQIEKWSNTMGTYLDLILNLNNLGGSLNAVTDAIADVARVAPAVAAIATRINRALAVINLLFAALDTPAPTQMGQALNGVNAMAATYSAGATLLGVAGYIGSFADLYLVPLTAAITARLGPLLNRISHDYVVGFMALGDQVVDMRNEPGGNDMFNFMNPVMHAAGPEGVPQPVPPTVERYLLDQRDALQAGAREDMPTTRSWIFWRSVDAAQIAQWVFAHRRQLWAMLYGSMAVPGPDVRAGSVSASAPVPAH